MRAGEFENKPKMSLIEELLPERQFKQEDIQKAFLAKEENRIGVERYGKKLSEQLSVLR